MTKRSPTLYVMQYLPRVRVGHNIAKLDPLGINEADLDSSIPPELIVDSSLDTGKVHASVCVCVCVCMCVRPMDIKWCIPYIHVGVDYNICIQFAQQFIL